MAKTDVLDILRTKQMDPLEFHFDNLWIYPMHYYLSQYDIDALHKIATSVRLSSQIRKKYKMIDDIMVPKGFKRFSAGTNRVIYRYYEDDRFLVKIAVDKVGMQDNPLEYKNQFFLKPFVAKTFYVSPCGTVAFSERVLPVKNVLEFKEIASDVFDILVNKILGLYVVEDVGTNYFMNWGIRPGFGPVLLDYPYVYDLDGDKLFCSSVNPDTGIPCNGEIDYDEGFNHLVCNRCGKIYLATDLRIKNPDNKIIIKRGGNQMRVVIKKGDKVVSEPIPMDDVMQRPAPAPRVMNHNFSVIINRPNKSKVNIPPVADNPYKDEPATNITKDDDIKKTTAEDNAEKESAKKEFFDGYDKVSTFIPKDDGVKKEYVGIPDPDHMTCEASSNDNYDCGVTEPYVNKEMETNTAYATASNDHDEKVDTISEAVSDDSETSIEEPEEPEDTEEHTAEPDDHEEETPKAADYYAIRGVTGSFNQDTPMFAGDGQTTQFKRKGSNKPQRDENGRFVSTKGNKSNGGYKKKGGHKNRDDDEE